MGADVSEPQGSCGQPTSVLLFAVKDVSSVQQLCSVATFKSMLQLISIIAAISTTGEHGGTGKRGLVDLHNIDRSGNFDSQMGENMSHKVTSKYAIELLLENYWRDAQVGPYGDIGVDFAGDGSYTSVADVDEDGMVDRNTVILFIEYGGDAKHGSDDYDYVQDDLNFDAWRENQ